ncbi:MAG: 3-beta hydroxysteroid dehydrogenase/isomerase family protein [Rubritepida sp.]|nr:3-beta hydroxysteroid dehydrogenase/isomerase family protein [Rubritepida sp.]
MKVFVTGVGGYIGGSIALRLIEAGHEVRGLVRKADAADTLRGLGITPVMGSLDDAGILQAEARNADAVVNAASSDHRAAVEAIIAGLAGSQKPFLHTSGSSIVGDASGGEASDRIFEDDTPIQPTADKAARVAIDRLIVASAAQGIRSAVLCNTLIYGHGLGLAKNSVQLPRLVRQARKSGTPRHVGRGLNIWSNVHISDVADLYLLALEKVPGGSFMFVENGEANFRDMTNAIGTALGLGPAQPWSIEEASAEWGYEMSTYALGSNSRVRGKRARNLGWAPRHGSVLDWIEKEVAATP